MHGLDRMSKDLNYWHGPISTGWDERLFSEAHSSLWGTGIPNAQFYGYQKREHFLSKVVPLWKASQRTHALPLRKYSWNFPSWYLTLAGSLCGRHPGLGSSTHSAPLQVMVLIGWELESIVWPPGERIWLWIIVILSLFLGSAVRLHSSLFFLINFIED